MQKIIILELEPLAIKLHNSSRTKPSVLPSVLLTNCVITVLSSGLINHIEALLLVISYCRQVMEKVAVAMSDLARILTGVLTESLGHKNGLFVDAGSCFLRLNRYPPCPLSTEIHGLVPHTDSDFLTILHQDQVGGLHLMKDSKWVSVKPYPKALIVNIGDLFQVRLNIAYDPNIMHFTLNQLLIQVKYVALHRIL